MKGETCGMPIKCFAGLKAEIYIYMTEGDHEWKKPKGLIKMLSMMN